MKKMYIALLLALLLVFTSGCGAESKSKVIIPKLTENENLLTGLNGYGKIFEFNIKDISKISLIAETWEKGQVIKESNIFEDLENEKTKLLLRLDMEKDEINTNTGFKWWYGKVEDGAILESYPMSHKFENGKVQSWSFEPGEDSEEKTLDLKPNREYILSSLSFSYDGHGLQGVSIGEVTENGPNSNDSIKNNDLVFLLRLKTGEAK